MEAKGCDCILSQQGWSTLEDLQLQMIPLLQKYQVGGETQQQWVAPQLFYNYQSAVTKSMIEYLHLLTHLDCLEISPLMSNGHFLIKLRDPLITTPVVLLYQVLDLTDPKDIIPIFRYSPFSHKVS